MTVTQKDIAQHAGVHPSTVSLALNGSDEISPKVRQRLRDLAVQMGYKKNPLVSALMDIRRIREPIRPGWAYIGGSASSGKYDNQIQQKRRKLCRGVAERAEQLGYSLDYISLKPKDATQSQFESILSRADLGGFAIESGIVEYASENFPWERYSCVIVDGIRSKKPVFHHVAEDYYTNAEIAVKELYCLGYKRTGFVLSCTRVDDHTASRWLAGYLGCQYMAEPEPRVPPFSFCPNEDSFGLFSAWFRKHRPDVLLAAPAVEQILSWLTRMDLDVPREVGLVSLADGAFRDVVAGVYCDPFHTGGLAAEVLAGMIRRKEAGIPQYPQLVLYKGRWSRGLTVRPLCP